MVTTMVRSGMVATRVRVTRRGDRDRDDEGDDDDGNTTTTTLHRHDDDSVSTPAW